MVSFSSSNICSFLSPKQVKMGDGASEKIGELFGTWQIQTGNVLVVADRQMVTLGLIDKVQTPLEAEKYPVFCFDNIVGEPTLDIAVELVEAARERNYVAVVGMGGGSAMDMAKLAAALAVNSGDVKDHFGATSFKNQPLPLVLIPTTAGTGAEATGISMLSVEGRKVIIVSPQLVPFAAVLDPQLTLTLPPGITAATGMDALSHALEGFMSTNANPFTDSQALSTMSVISTWLKRAYDDGSNIEARRAMGYAAYTGGLSLNAGVVLGHSVAYTIANHAKMSHGISCAMALPFTVAYNSLAVSDRLSKAAVQVTGHPGASPGDLALWISELNSYLKIPGSLKAIGLEEADLGEMEEECLNRYPRPTNPKTITPESLRVFYQMMFEGDIKGCVDAFGNASV
jgi:alcohol dehydrogenase class IV